MREHIAEGAHTIAGRPVKLVIRYGIEQLYESSGSKITGTCRLLLKLSLTEAQHWDTEANDDHCLVDDVGGRSCLVVQDSSEAGFEHCSSGMLVKLLANHFEFRRVL